ncbi:MAG: YbfB/YjiJ family MFS transporter, partial [Ilumatobacteraceae bacterium]
LADAAPAAEFSAAFAAVTVAFSVAQAFGPQIGGVLVDRTGGFAAALITSAAALVLAALVSIGLPRLGRSDSMPAPPVRT